MVFKPKTVSWRDYFASRAIRLNSFVATFSAVVLPVVLSLSDNDLASLGVSPRGVVIVSALIAIALAFQNNRLRVKTDKPLVGRSDVHHTEIIK